ncbi:MAG: hypothetical protein HYR56_23255 [Acidobacteria bacterium]|nr:hypothetical protein [Acidobacteriota bacterium]MBI3426108.1 hypothetical protein [Acidobacteriota bacterium]
MTLSELQSDLNQLLHQPVSFKRIAGNSIIIYFFDEPGDSNVVSIFTHTSWRYQKDGKVVIGSYDLLIDEDDFNSVEEYEQRFDYLCSLTDELSNADLLACFIDPESSDLTLKFSNEQVIHIFANSAFDNIAWTYRNIPQQICANVSPSGVEIKTIDK